MDPPALLLLFLLSSLHCAPSIDGEPCRHGDHLCECYDVEQRECRRTSLSGRGIRPLNQLEVDPKVDIVVDGKNRSFVPCVKGDRNCLCMSGKKCFVVGAEDLGEVRKRVEEVERWMKDAHSPATPPPIYK